MRTANELRELINGLMTKLSAVDTKATNERRDLTAAELTFKSDVMDEVEALKAELEIVERQDALRASLDQSNPPATVIPGNDSGSVIATHIESASQARNLTRGPFGSLGEQLVAVRSAAGDGTIDPRLHEVRAASGLSESIPSDGGFLVQQDFTAQLLNDVFQTGMLASRCRRISISSNSNSLKINGVDETSRTAGNRWGGIRGYWADEAEEKTGSKPKFRKIELNLNKLIGLCYATDELLDDASALEGVIRQGFASEFGFLVDDSIVNGTGAGMPLGILNAGCTVSVAKETGQAAATILFENIVKMWSRLFAASRPSSVWYINQDTEPQLFAMNMAVGTGGVPVYMPAGGISGQPYSTLFGRPVIAIEQCATLGTVGDVILSDLSNGYILAEKGGVATDVSIHVRFVYDETAYRFVMRIDGQPVRASALTPYKGSNTQSHFITLATRS